MLRRSCKADVAEMCKPPTRCSCSPSCVPPCCCVCRQANWRLDPALRRSCKADVAEMCKLEDGRGSETGEVYHCLIHNHDDLDPGG